MHLQGSLVPPQCVGLCCFSQPYPLKLPLCLQAISSHRGTAIRLYFAAFINFRAFASSSRTYAFLVPLKGFFVRYTFIPTDVSSWRQLLTASVTSSVSAVGSMSSISTSTVGTRWRTDPDSPTTRERQSPAFLYPSQHIVPRQRYLSSWSLESLLY